MQINILEYFARSLKENPERTAIIDRERSYTFTEIAIHSKFLAINLVTTNCPIAVYLPKSAEAIIADLAIIFSGNYYMNLDVKSPAQRVKNIIEGIDPVKIITDERHSQDLADMGVLPIK